MPIAEAAHELGRTGALRAKRLLQDVLGTAIELPFNAYDHPHRLAFTDSTDFGGRGETFRFDLAGVLKKTSADHFDQQEVVEVFVEVKTHSSANNLLDEYREFLRHSAIANAAPAHRGSWFIFYATVPFGSSRAADLVNGKLLTECVSSWSEALKESSTTLNNRIVLAIATDSFVRLLNGWRLNVA